MRVKAVLRLWEEPDLNKYELLCFVHTYPMLEQKRSSVANIERMTVVFPEPMAAQIRAAVEAGEYATTSEAVRDAVRLWSAWRQMQENDLERVRQAWDAVKASGPHRQIDFDDLRQEARRRLADAEDDAGHPG